jgi:hypothetical protein
MLLESIRRQVITYACIRFGEVHDKTALVGQGGVCGANVALLDLVIGSSTRAIDRISWRRAIVASPGRKG